MKKIIIFQKNNAPLEIFDDEKISNEEYSRKIVNIFNSNVISMIHTSSCSIVVRPNTILSVQIEDFNKPEFFDNTSKQIENQGDAEKEGENLDNDIITD